jgi:hypothetical protein
VIEAVAPPFMGEMKLYPFSRATEGLGLTSFFLDQNA